MLHALQVRLPLSDFEGGNASRDGLIAGHDYLVAREDLLQQCRDFRGLRRRLGDRIVSDQDRVDHGARRAGPSSGHYGEGAGRPARRECVSPVVSAPVWNRARRELDNDEVDQIQIGTLIRTAPLLLRSSVTISSAPDTVGELLSVCASTRTLSWVPLRLSAA